MNTLTKPLILVAFLLNNFQCAMSEKKKSKEKKKNPDAIRETLDFYFLLLQESTNL